MRIIDAFDLWIERRRGTSEVFGHLGRRVLNAVPGDVWAGVAGVFFQKKSEGSQSLLLFVAFVWFPWKEVVDSQ